MQITDAQLREMFPSADARLTPHLPYMNDALSFGEITTPLRQAAFLAQVAHESGCYLYMEEIWGPTDAQLGYEGRADLGNVQPGDGIKYKGRGPLQITGRSTYQACGAFMRLPLVVYPELLTRPEHATRSAAWFWRHAKPWLNACADRGWFRVTTRLINGGLNGIDERLRYYQRNLRILGLPLYEPSAETQSIREFQHEHGLLVDGDCGARTLAALMRESQP